MRVVLVLLESELGGLEAALVASLPPANVVTTPSALTAAEFNSGNFTISNLGMFGVAAFDAILPPGQARTHTC